MNEHNITNTSLALSDAAGGGPRCSSVTRKSWRWKKIFYGAYAGR
ncbi:Uncharacterised protein [Salmonella enterica subsp. enterica]|uniref:Uncharacterized protein n=1 Tax=Salmonella enterica I TaxID=59201 RepID=A0A3S4JHZ8_SALET|nr:Uncharacterised protein [Salmonella enterica subsp. enterica]